MLCASRAELPARGTGQHAGVAGATEAIRPEHKNKTEA